MGPRTSGLSRNRRKPGGTSSEKASEHNTVINNNENNSTTEDTANTDTTAKLKHRILDLAKRVMRGEERTVFFGVLLKLGMGTKEVEGFVKKQARLRRLGVVGRVGR